MEAPVETRPDLPHLESALPDLERRVQALESAVARIDDSQALEDRVVARLSSRLPQAKVADPLDAVIEERVAARTQERAAAAAAAAAAAVPEAAATASATASAAAARGLRWGGGWSSWLFFDMWREAKLLVRMMFDRRYTMAWTTRLITIIFLPAILTAHWWLPLLFLWFPLMWLDLTRYLCVNLINLILAFALYKALSREAQRYKDTVWRS